MGRARAKNRLFSGGVAALIVFGGAALVDVPSAAAVDGLFTVTRTADDHAAGSLRNAIDQANAGAYGAVTITLPAGTYTLNQCAAGADDTNVAGDLDATSSAALTLHGQGGRAVIRQTCAGERVLDKGMASLLVLDDVTITGGRAVGTPAVGGGVRTAGAATIVRSRFEDNEAATGATPVVGLEGRGGGLAAGGNVTVSESSFVANKVWGGQGLTTSQNLGSGGVGRGGALATPAASSLVNSTFDGNWAYGGLPGFEPGIGVAGSGGAAEGGAVTTGSATMTAVTFTNNVAQGGPGWYTFPYCPVNCEVPSGFPGGRADGGAVFGSGLVHLDDTTATNNAAQGGDGVSGSTFAASEAEGGVVASAGDIEVVGSVLSSNHATSAGGALRGRQVAVAGTDVDDNYAKYSGGAIQANLATADSSTISRNRTTGSGGGIHAQPGGRFSYSSVTIRNSTLTGNEAAGNTPYSGAAVWTQTLDVQQTTIASNTGAAALQAATLTTKQSVLVGETGGSLCGPGTTTTSTGHNWADDGSCGLSDPTDHTGPEPVALGPLQANGGPTLTRAPAPTSPLVNAVPAGSCASPLDQRSVSRPQGAGCDIGAVELSGNPSPPAAPTAVAGDGQATVSWVAPASLAPITGYTVTATPGGASCSWTSGPLTCTVTGLAIGTAHTFRVTATSALGTSAPSPASNPVTPWGISSLSTNIGPTTGGQIAIRGSGFTGATEVKFGGVTTQFINNDTLILAFVPPHAAGFVNVTVTTPQGTTGVALKSFYIYSATAPGSIHGNVTVEGHGPPASSTVYVMPANENVFRAFAITAPDGSFTLTDLMPGTYKLLALDWAQFQGTPGYGIAEYYDNKPGPVSLPETPTAPAFATATTITVTAGATTNLNPIVLTPAP
jgi:hypothetical protein